MEEKKIIEHLKNGDDFIYKYVYEKYIRMILNVCYGLTNNRYEAEDASQDVFIKVFNSIHTFREESKLSTWIYRITLNICKNRLRRKKIISILSLNYWGEDDKEGELIADNANPMINIEKSELQQIVREAIDSLPVKQKSAIILSRYEEKSYAEIADILETTIPAVESLLFRAKENLAKKLIELKR